MSEFKIQFKERLSPRLRSFVERDRDDIEEVTRRSVQLITDAVPEYHQSNEPRMLGDLRDSVRTHAELWFEALLSSRPLDRESLNAVEFYGRRRVHQGVSLAGMLRAARVLALSFWYRLLQDVGDESDLHTELLFKVSPYLLQHFDIAAEAMAVAFLEEQGQYARWRDRLRQELWSIVASRPEDYQGFRKHAEALGLDPTGTYCALVLQFRNECHERLEAVADPALLAVGRALRRSSNELMWAVHRDHLVVWVGVPREKSTIAFDQELAAIGARFTQRESSVTAIGIGLPGTGAHGWNVSMEQGFRALAMTKGGSKSATAYRFSRFMLDDALSVSDNVAEFMGAMIETLAGTPCLLETLQTYLDHKRHRKATAGALNVHPNTLDHRLERIESLLDGKFDDIDWLSRLHVALRHFRPEATKKKTPEREYKSGTAIMNDHKRHSIAFQ